MPTLLNTSAPAARRAGALEPLIDTHAQMLTALDALGVMLVRLQAIGVDAEVRTLAARVVSFFDGEARHHHAEEEREVFPALLQCDDDALVQQVRRLQQDHGWLEENWIALGPQLDALSHGQSWVDPDLLTEQVDTFRALYQEHIALEESIVYPEALRRRQLASDQAAGRLQHWRTR